LAFKIKDFFKEAGKIGLEVLKETTYKSVAAIPKVKEEAAEEATKKAKNVLWAALPFIAIGTILLLLFKKR